jgi:hypothetical protein
MRTNGVDFTRHPVVEAFEPTHKLRLARLRRQRPPKYKNSPASFGGDDVLCADDSTVF